MMSYCGHRPLRNRLLGKTHGNPCINSTRQKDSGSPFPEGSVVTDVDFSLSLFL